MKRVFLVLAAALVLTACSSHKESEEATQDDNKESVYEATTTMLSAEDETNESVYEATTTTMKAEEETSEKMEAEEEQKEETVADRRFAKVDRFYEDFISNNTSKDRDELSAQVEIMAKKYGLFSDSKNTGLGVMYYKVATSSEEAKLISNDDLKRGTYFVYIVGDFRKGSPLVCLVDNRTGTTKETTPDSDKESEQETMEGSTNETAQTDVMDNETFFATVKDEIRWALGPRDRIEDISIEDNNLKLLIYLSQNDNTVGRFTGITDHILKIEDGYDLWDTVTVDFGSLGYITKSKDDIFSDEKGMHFSVDKSDIVK